MFIVSPSIYSADFMHLAEQLDKLHDIENLHLDIDDGNFVREISFGMKIIQAIAEHTTIPLDAHLEVLNPMDYVEHLINAGIRRICAHIEQLPYPSFFLSTVRRAGCKAGLALNLKTPIEQLLPFADQLDYILLVSVEMDCDGLIFRSGVLDKIRQARRILKSETQIWVDGGVNDKNFKEVVNAGADAIVMGRAIFETPSPDTAWKYYRDLGEALCQARNRG